MSQAIEFEDAQEKALLVRDDSTTKCTFLPGHDFNGDSLGEPGFGYVTLAELVPEGTVYGKAYDFEITVTRRPRKAGE